MQAAIIGLLFTVLVIALVLGYIMYRLSNTPKISDLNKVIDDVNALGETITDQLLQNSENVEENKASNESLRDLYDDLLKKSNDNATKITSYASSNLSLKDSVEGNTGSISTIQTDLMDNYAKTTELGDYAKTTELGGYMDSHTFDGLSLGDGPLSFGDSRLLVSEEGALTFCGTAEDTSCASVALNEPSGTPP